MANTYEILGPLGRGGMGELFRARNTRTERRVALKLLRPDAKSRADAVERFRREARAAGMINSDHVTQVLDILEDPVHGIAIAFELLEGDNLLDHLRRTGPMDLPTIRPIVEQILRGMVDAHAVGIIHRDLKPSNIFLESRPNGPSRIKILDFGISKLPKSMAKNTITEPHQALGSFMFMPPEQIQRAASVDHRADIYALGTLVFQAMTGHLPYSSRSMAELVQLKTAVEPRTLEQASGKRFSPRLEAWIARCLMRDREARFQTAAEALAAWRALGDDDDDDQEAATLMMSPAEQGYSMPSLHRTGAAFGATPPPPAPAPAARPPEAPYGAPPLSPRPPPTPYASSSPSAPMYPSSPPMAGPPSGPRPGAPPPPPYGQPFAGPFQGPQAPMASPAAMPLPSAMPSAPGRKGPWLIVLAVSLVVIAFTVGAGAVYLLTSR